MKSLLAFEENIKSTELFTYRIHAMSNYLKPKKDQVFPPTMDPQIIKMVSFDESHFEKIFETGFISLFANFEHFMYEFIKELYTKQPKAIPIEKTIKAEDILQFKNYKSIYEFLVDSVAIENSYELETWNSTVQKLFSIKPIPDEVKIKLMILNSMRNLFLHSGGHWNSKTVKDSRKIEKAFRSEKTGEKNKKNESQRTHFKTTKSALTPEIAYRETMICFKQIIKDLQQQIDKKKGRQKNKA